MQFSPVQLQRVHTTENTYKTLIIKRQYRGSLQSSEIHGEQCAMQS